MTAKPKSPGALGLLFLDIDGVLNSIEWAKKCGGQRGYRDMDPDAVAQLKRICETATCAIVVSSTWRRLYTIAEIREKLEAAGFPNAPILGQTPTLFGRWRGDEVCAFFDSLEAAGIVAGTYVCLDDDRDFYPQQPLVRTSTETGLTAKEADECIAILRAPARPRFRRSIA